MSIPTAQFIPPSLSPSNISLCINLILCLVIQSCPTFCDHVNCSLPRSSVHGDSPGKNTGVGSLSLLQGIFPIQGLNSGFHIAGGFFTI